jgi:uncharacterized protein YjiS (DUF1127 family)
MSATMTTCTTTSCRPLAARESRSFLAWIAEVVVREFRVRRDMRVLASFDEAALHDIGLTRGSMEGALRYGRSDERLMPALGGQEPTVLPHSLVEWR